jgi:hypothetical protein
MKAPKELQDALKNAANVGPADCQLVEISVTGPDPEQPTKRFFECMGKCPEGKECIRVDLGWGFGRRTGRRIYCACGDPTGDPPPPPKFCHGEVNRDMNTQADLYDCHKPCEHPGEDACKKKEESVRFGRYVVILTYCVCERRTKKKG